MSLPTPTSTLDDPSHSELHTERVNVKSFGCVGDGVVDDTVALQAAIDAATGTGLVSTTRVADYELFLPAGTYKVTAPLVIRSVIGFSMRGSGAGSTIILGSGTFSPVLDLNGVAHSHFSDFKVQGTASGSNDILVHLQWTAGTGRSTSKNLIENVFCADGRWRVAFQVQESTTTQSDETLFLACHVGGTWTVGETSLWQYGFRLGGGTSGNTLTNSLVQCNTNYVRYGTAFACSGGSVVSMGCQYNGSDFVMEARPGDPIFIAGVRSENSTRLWEHPLGAAGYAVNVCLQDIYWTAQNLNADGYVFKFHAGGSWTIERLFVTNAGGVTPTFWINNGGGSPRAHARIIQCSTKTAGASVISTTTGFTYDLVNYYQNDDSSLFTGTAFNRTTGGEVTRVVATASLPAAAAAMDGNIIIEDAGTGDRNLIIYAGGQRFRIDGGANV